MNRNFLPFHAFSPQTVCLSPQQDSGIRAWRMERMSEVENQA